MRHGITLALSTSLSISLAAGYAHAHTASVGFLSSEGKGDSFDATIYYGSWHATVGGAEGSMRLEGVDSNFDQTDDFELVDRDTLGYVDQNTAPTEFEAGVNYLWAVGNEFKGEPGSPIYRFQGAGFAGLNPGKYTFGYDAGSALTQDWQPASTVINEGAFTLNEDGSFAIEGAETCGDRDRQDVSGETICLDEGTITATDAAGGADPITTDIEVEEGGGTFDTNGLTLSVTSNLSGSGALAKTGAGTLVFSGDGSGFSGSFGVDGGTLSIQSNLTVPGGLSVNNGGRFSGNGTINGNVTVGSGGTLAPGTSPGTMTVSGDVTQAPGSTFEVEIDGYGTGDGAGSFDRLILTDGGTYTADGTIAPVLRGISAPANNTFTPEIGDRFVVVEADGGIAGTFDAIDQPGAGLPAGTRFDVVYDGAGDRVILAVIPVDTAASLEGVARLNAVNLAAALDDVRDDLVDGGTSAKDRFFEGLTGLGAAELARVLQQASGEIHATGLAAGREAGRVVRGQALARADHLAGGTPTVAALVAPEPIEVASAELGDDAFAHLFMAGDSGLRPQVWVETNGVIGEVDDDDVATGHDFHGWSITTGFDFLRTETVTVGVAGGFARADFDTDDVGDGDHRSGHLMLYGGGVFDNLQTGLVVGASYDRYETERRVDLSTGSVEARGEADGFTLSIDADIGYQHEQGDWLFVPAVGVRAERIWREAFEEEGSALIATEQPSAAEWTAEARAGFTLGRDVDLAIGKLGLAASVFLKHDFGDGRILDSDARLHGAAWSVESADPGRTAAELGLGAGLELSDRVGLYADYTAELREGARAHRATAGVRVLW